MCDMLGMEKYTAIYLFLFYLEPFKLPFVFL